MPKTTVDELVRGARFDALFDEEYTSEEASTRRAMGKALFHLRTSRDLTPAALAEGAGWEERDVTRIERGDPRLIASLVELETFARATDATTIVLFVDRNTSMVCAQLSLGDRPSQTIEPPR